MFVEQRTYTMYPGRLPEYLHLFEAEGFAIYQETLGRVIGVFSSETGALNQLIVMVAYSDLNERMARRAALARNPDWARYSAKARQMIVTQESRIMLPAAFSPLR